MFRPFLSLLLLILTQICGGRHSLSYSECIRLERWATDGGAGGPNGGQSSVAKVVSVREGYPAYLHCPQPKRQRRKELKAAWTRLSDEALLAVGTSTFTLDPRFQVSKPRKNESDWVLILKRPGPRDQGCYLCEMNTEPTSTLVPTYLKVSIDTEVEEGHTRTTAVEGIGKMHRLNTYLQTSIEGDLLLLNCTVEGETGGELPLEVQWTRDGRPIDIFGRGRYSTSRHVSNNGAAVLFSLRMRAVSPEDSGLYACDGHRLVRSAQTINLVPPPHSSAVGRSPTVPNFVTFCRLSLCTLSWLFVATFFQIFRE